METKSSDLKSSLYQELDVELQPSRATKNRIDLTKIKEAAAKITKRKKMNTIFSVISVIILIALIVTLTYEMSVQDVKRGVVFNLLLFFSSFTLCASILWEHFSLRRKELIVKMLERIHSKA